MIGALLGDMYILNIRELHVMLAYMLAISLTWMLRKKVSAENETEIYIYM